LISFGGPKKDMVFDDERTQILALLGQGLETQQIARQLGVSVQQVAAIKAHITMGTYASPSAGSEEVAEAMETTFSPERDLQAALRANIEQLEPGLKITDGGKEQSVASGRIDIAAEDQSGANVVIELKTGSADRDAVGQILSYMGDLAETKKSVRGIIVAGDFSARALAAARAVPNIQLKKYAFRFSFESVR
jgi:RecB family endonuclease NucS